MKVDFVPINPDILARTSARLVTARNLVGIIADSIPFLAAKMQGSIEIYSIFVYRTGIRGCEVGA